MTRLALTKHVKIIDLSTKLKKMLPSQPTSPTIIIDQSTAAEKNSCVYSCEGSTITVTLGDYSRHIGLKTQL